MVRSVCGHKALVTQWLMSEFFEKVWEKAKWV